MAKPFIIGLTGGSGSGKTTFISRIRQTFTAAEVCIVSQDDFYKPREKQMKDTQGITNFDVPEAIDREAFIRDIHRLLEGEVVERLEYTYNNPLAKPQTITFQPAPILFIEGIFVLHYPEIRSMIDLTIFLHARENLKIVRRINRDRIERNYPLEDVLYRYINHVAPTFEKYIRPFQEEADIVINNNDQFDRALDVVVGFIRSKLP